MSDRALALLRFDFALAASREAVVTELRDRYGAPLEAPAGRAGDERDRMERTFDVSDPAGLGLPAAFDAVTIRVIAESDAVVELITVATVADGRLAATGSGNGGIAPEQLREWENRLGTVRSVVPDTLQGPETTVFWAKTDAIPDALRSPPIDLEAVGGALAADELETFLEPFGAGADSGLLLLGDETLLVPRDRGKLWGTLLAIELDGQLESTIDSNGRRLSGPWRTLASLYAIHYWCLARRNEIETFEAELDRVDASLPSTDGTVDSTAYADAAADLEDRRGDRTVRAPSIDTERRQLGRRLERVANGLDARSWRRTTAGAPGDSPALMDAYRFRLEDELDGVRQAADRVTARLEALSTGFQQRLTMAATRATLRLQQRLGDRVEDTVDLQRQVYWLSIAFVTLAVVLVADVVMTGGLEAFIDRLFEEGFRAVTTQILAGVVLASLAVAAAVYARRS